MSRQEVLVHDLYTLPYMVANILFKQRTLSDNQVKACDNIGPSHNNWIDTLMAISCNTDNPALYVDESNHLHAKVMICRLAQPP